MLPTDRGISTYLLIAIVAGVLAAGVAAYIFFAHSAPSPQSLPEGQRTSLTEEHKAYLPALELTDVRMSAAENFLGTSVTYLDARVTNKGTRLVRHLDLQLEFVDMLHQVVLRETAHPITDRTSPLKPGETRAFQVTFEHMPMDWNQAPPRITPMFVQF